MRAQVAAGRPASALAAFARMRQLLAEELGADPAPATLALHEQVLTARTDGPPGRTPEPQRPGGLVGRDRELRALDAELRHSTAGTRLVLLTGEPGIGKTTLLDQWSRSSTGRGAVVLRGRAEEGELALQPVLDALAAQLAVLTLDGAAPGGLPGPAASADALSLRVFAQIDDALGALPSGSGPSGLGPSGAGTALVIDDGDVADTVTWAWPAHARRRRLLPLLLVVAVRDRAAAAVEPDIVLELAPLTVAEAGLLVGTERAVVLLERSGGNPLLLTELADAGATGPEEVPGSLREAVTARLRRTGSAEPTLQAAAVLGAVIDLDLLASVLRTAPLEVLEHLDVGVRQAFLVERQGSLAFRHELVRLAVAAGAGPARRAWLHRSAAELLRTRPDANPLELARHAREGGDRGLAAEALTFAADVARARLDLPGAERLLDAAIDLHDSGPLRLRRSRVRMSRSDLDGAEADAEAAMATDDSGEALELRAWVARNRLDRRGTAVRYAGVQHTYRSWILRNLGDPAAEELALAGLELAGSREILAQCHLDTADCLLRAGDLAGAADRIAVAEVESGSRWFHNKWRFDQRRHLLRARLRLAQRDATAALDAAETVVAAAEDRGDARYAVLGRLVRATANARLGQAVDVARVGTDLDQLGEVAALEGWWLAADVADATSSPRALAVSVQLAEHVEREAGGHRDAFRAMAAARLG